ncbi:MAG TPA: signal peptidase II [Flavobacteriaceae bacterium]|nr:signal peptidase II [Flavobacteriaceae bacterium]
MKLSRNLSIILLIAGTIAIDQISKVIVRANVVPYKESKIIGSYLTLNNVENTGAFLGMGSGLNPTIKLIFLLILPVFVLGYLIYYIFKNKQMATYGLIALCCIAGGGIANVFDRIAFGHVTDFLHIDLGGVFKTGIFNLADLSVTTGLIVLLIGNFANRDKTKNHP